MSGVQEIAFEAIEIAEVIHRERKKRRFKCSSS
jgi:hypothetical protein